MTNYDKGVLFEREGSTPEVGVRIGNEVEFIDGTRVQIQDGDYVDAIDVSVLDWEPLALRVLARGLEARTQRQLGNPQS